MTRQLIAIQADDRRKADLSERKIPDTAEYIFTSDSLNTEGDTPAAYFILNDVKPEDLYKMDLKPGIPIFADAVNYSLDFFPAAMPLAIVNAWPGFLKNEILELSYRDNDQSLIENFLNSMRWKFTRIADQPGLAVPRLIAMIVNEACFAINEGVSTPEEIDISMRIGTNYPYGPFEWSRIIGPERIISLLETLTPSNERYTTAPGIKSILAGL